MKKRRKGGWHSTAVPGTEASHREAQRRTYVDLPPGVQEPFDVYVNGVKQERGRDYRIQGFSLVFDRPLAREGRLGFWRWLSMFLGIAGTYRQNDTVDVVYELGGRREVATGLPLRQSSTR
jgi:hypothetical protein